MGSITGKGYLDENSLLNIEEALYGCDFGVDTIEEIIDSIRDAHRTQELRSEKVSEIARNVIKKILDGSERDFVFDKEEMNLRFYVWWCEWFR